MKIGELKEYDSAEFLTNEETIRHYLACAFEDGDARVIQRALGVVARARGMTAIAKASGVKREALYRALSQDGNPEFTTILKVMDALGLRLTLSAGISASRG